MQDNQVLCRNISYNYTLYLKLRMRSGEEVMKKILVVDDELTLRMLIRATLEDIYEIFEAEDGIAGMELARSVLPDLIILDMMMPGITGLEVCRKLKGNPATSAIKILLLTAKSQQRDQEAALEAGVDYFLAKPFSPANLIVMVAEILKMD